MNKPGGFTEKGHFVLCRNPRTSSSREEEKSWKVMGPELEVGSLRAASPGRRLQSLCSGHGGGQQVDLGVGDGELSLPITGEGWVAQVGCRSILRAELGDLGSEAIHPSWTAPS